MRASVAEGGRRFGGQATLALVRIPDWWPYLGLLLLGGVLGEGREGVRWALGTPLAWSFLYLAGLYAWNGACDAGSDRPGKNPAAGGRMGREEALRLAVALQGISLVLAPLLLGTSWRVGVGLVLLGFVYSLPRWGLKRHPVVGTVANLGLFLPLLVLGWGGGAPPRLVDIALPILLLSLPALSSQLVHEIQDTFEDQRGQSLTTARWMGPTPTRWVAVLLSLGTAGVAGAAVAMGRLPGLEGGAMGLAGLVSAWPGGVDEEGARRWRRRIRVSFLVGCGAWLAAGWGGGRDGG